MRESTPHRILIFRIGSLGDTVIALPIFNMLARRFPNSDRRLLTNLQTNPKAPSPRAILGDGALIQSYIDYPLGTRSIRAIFAAMLAIRRWRPDVLVYLREMRPAHLVKRDLLFLRLCGIRRIVGAGLDPRDFEYRRSSGGDLWESEVERLTRMALPLGDAEPANPASWDFRFTDDERKDAANALSALPVGQPFLALCPGTKQSAKDWGEENWRKTVTDLASSHPELGLVFVGAEEERDRADRLGSLWSGLIVNFCGRLSPRVSALVLGRALLYLGHDTGPMHLAAAQQVPCVAIFNAAVRPGLWFPYGSGHHVFYNWVDCGDCHLGTCVEQQKKCILAISASEVVAAVDRVISRGAQQATRAPIARPAERAL